MCAPVPSASGAANAHSRERRQLQAPLGASRPICIAWRPSNGWKGAAQDDSTCMHMSRRAYPDGEVPPESRRAVPLLHQPPALPVLPRLCRLPPRATAPLHCRRLHLARPLHARLCCSLPFFCTLIPPRPTCPERRTAACNDPSLRRAHVKFWGPTRLWYARVGNLTRWWATRALRKAYGAHLLL